MSKEPFKYDHSNKELLFKALTGVLPQAYLGISLQEEVNAIESGNTTPDFLELLSGQLLLDSVRLIQEMLSHSSLENIGCVSGDSFSQEKQQRLINFFRVLESLLTSADRPQDISLFVYKNRKSFGFPSNAYELKYLADLLMECFNQGFGLEGELCLVNFPGSFSPAPHIGHIEVANLIDQNLTLNSKRGRIVVTTASRDSKRLTSSKDFVFRLNNMYRGFIGGESVTVLGITGDMIDLSQRIEQLLLLSQFDSEKQLRFVLGSDNFIKKIKEAQDGEIYAKFLLDKSHQLYLSVRPDEDVATLQVAIRDAELLFSVKPIVLFKQKVLLSGTTVRSLPLAERPQFYPNSYIVDLI